MANPLTEFPKVTRTGNEKEYAIPSSEWNSVVKWMSDHMPVIMNPGKDTRFFPHPWFTQLRWDTEGEQFKATTRPGFIRGHDVQVNTLGRLLSDYRMRVLEATEEGPPNPLDKVREVLSDDPWFEVKTDTWRIVAGPSHVVLEGDEPAAVPEIFFTRHGVARPAELQVDVEAQRVVIDQSESQSSASKGNNRSLARCYIVLAMPRPRVEVVEVDDPTLPAGSVLSAQVRYMNPKTDPPTLSVRRDLPPELAMSGAGTVERQSIEQLLTSSDKPFDYLLVATLWAVSPPKDTTDKVAQSWRIHVQHSLWWNLDYTVDAEVNQVEPTRFVNPAAALFGGGFAAQDQVDLMNRNVAQIEALAARVNVSGEFWSI